jgi:hypothetical protein
MTAGVGHRGSTSALSDACCVNGPEELSVDGVADAALERAEDRFNSGHSDPEEL